MTKDDTVEVTLRLPKNIVSFLEDMGENLEEYIVYVMVDNIAAGLDADAWVDPKHWVNKHKLMPIFKKHEIPVSSYIDPTKPYH